ncbi:DUF4054 domain-containing protein [Limnohabitans sp.]|uniref:DUF4054 domain-containing protein n=1 Tax=Limnohabitans sp. TaxID=1907725 RepID=UPI00286EE1EE|nr:DUF4054 domain-containing protein [Limnohabitans sp.]
MSAASDAFRAKQPIFASATNWPDLAIDAAIAEAQNYTDLTGYPLDLMTGHLLELAANAGKNGTGQGGVVQSAGIDGVSVSMAPPPVKGMLQYNLAQTIMGQKLLMYLKTQSVGGLYAGGSTMRGSLR